MNPHQVDGYLNTLLEYEGEKRQLNLLMEFQYNGNLSRKINVSQILIQALYYIKKFEQSSKLLPNVIFIGDESEYLIILSDELNLYLKEDNIDWSMPATTACDYNFELLSKLNKNSEINPLIFKLSEGFDFEIIIEEIKDILFEDKTKTEITRRNIYELYLYFIQNIVING